MALQPDQSIRNKLASLSPEALEQLLQKLPATDTSTEDNGEANVGHFPATYSQLLFWMQYSANPEAAENHQSMAFYIHGPVYVEALQEAFRWLSFRQPSLRTVYFEEGGDVWQRILPILPIPFEYFDMSGSEMHEETSFSGREAFLASPFDLSTQPPIRVRLTRRGENLYLLDIVLHHIAVDGRSKVIMLEELSELYQAARHGRSKGSKLPLNHAGFLAKRERSWLSGPDGMKAMEYWKSSPFLKGLEHSWPQHREWGNTNKIESAHLEFSFDTTLTEKIRAFAAERGMTTLQLLMGCYGLCIQRLMATNDITIGMPVDIRQSEEESLLIGCLMNIVPVTIEGVHCDSIESYLKLAAEQIKLAVENSRLPFYRLLEETFSDRQRDNSFRWKTIVNVKEDYAGVLRIADAEVEDLTFLETGRSGDLILTFSGNLGRSGKEPIRLTAETDVTALSLRDVSSLLHTWQWVIRQVVESPFKKITDIDILLPGEQERLQELFGLERQVSYPVDKTLVDLFEEQVQRTPDALALRYNETVLTYSELNARANQLAHHLIDIHGMVSDQMVGIELSRSEWMVIGMLAIIKSGGAYVPIDPNDPPQRKNFIREDAQLAIILDQKELDRFRRACSRLSYPTSNPEVKVRPENIVYVIYTSGTTGNPKGVLIEHRNVVRLLFNDSFPFDFSRSDVWTMAHSYNFDFSVWEMYGALLYGGELIVVPLEVVKDAHAFAELLIDRGVTVLNQTPSAFYPLSDLLIAHPRSREHRLRYVIFGGDALQPTRLEGWHTLFPQTKKVNMYGITETTVHVTYKEIGIKEIEEGKCNIGRPIPTLSCYVLNQRMDLCAPGLAGELYVSGLGLARGYLNRKELTEERFISDPFRPGERMYRTGDVCRWREDGNLEYLGRMDDQVKIRGFRIELGDVENALLSFNGVRDAVVKPTYDGMGSSQLRAWVTLEIGCEANESDIRREISRLLPEYMIPFRIDRVGSIPLTSQGKVDYHALLELSASSGIVQVLSDLINETEIKLAGLWSEILNVDVRSRNANFFRLGGHSLLAMRLSQCIQKSFNAKISLSDLYEAPSLHALAALIDSQLNLGISEGISSGLQDKVCEAEAYPASGMETLYWEIQKADAAKDARVVSGFHIQGRLNVTALKKAFELLIASQSDLRTVFFEQDGCLYRRILPHMPLAFELVHHKPVDPSYDNRENQPGFRDFLTAPFLLETGPLMRIRLTRKSDDEHWIQIALHHTVADAASMITLLEHVSSYYNSILSGGILFYPTPKGSMRDFAAIEASRKILNESEKSRQFWLQSLRKRGLDLSWPKEDDGSSLQTKPNVAFATLEWAFGAGLMDGIEKFANEIRSTRFRILLGGLFLLMRKLHPGSAITVGIPVDQRKYFGIEGLVGCLINMLPVTLDGDRPGKVGHHMSYVSALVKEALGHSWFPYHSMIQEWVDKSDEIGSNRWRTIFNMKPSEDGHLKLVDTKSDLLHPFINEAAQHLGAADLTITMHQGIPHGEKKSGMVFLKYDTRVLDNRIVTGIVQAWESVIQQCLANPDAHIDDITLPGILGDIADRKRKNQQEDRRRRLEGYWQQRLSQMDEYARILPDRNLSLSGPGRSARVSRSLDHLQHRMHTFASSQGISRYSHWMSLWQLLLARLGSASEVLIATSISERIQPDRLDVWSMCHNTLPVRIFVDPQSSFRNFSRHSHQAFTQDLAHAHLPYKDILHASGIDLGPDSNGLPQAMFSLHGEDLWNESESCWTQQGSEHVTIAKNPISLHLSDDDGSCQATLIYDIDQFLPQTAEAILHRFEIIATQVLDKPDIRLTDIDILIPGERDRIVELSGRHDTKSYPQTTLHQIFRETALRYPYRTAVISADGTETNYSEIQQQSRQVAGYLRAQGIEKEAVVAIHLQRSPAVLASIIGILEAGGAFLLLEPSLPLERLRTMALQAQVTIILSNHGMPTIPGFEKNTHSYHEVLLQQFSEEASEDHDMPAPHMLAYVMFTSGSTGTPKGAKIEHRNLINYLCFNQETLALDISDRTLQKSSFSFDVCLFEWLLPMLTGGAVVLPEPSRLNDIEHIADKVYKSHVSLLDFTPSALRVFVEMPDIQKTNGILRAIRCGGEGLSHDLMHDVLKKIKAKLYHGYGPAETSIAVSQWICQDDKNYVIPPIGKAYANVELLIMDTNGRPMPPGMPGELWIGGAQTGRGYIHNEEETRKRFVDDPLDSNSGKRFYRTGDMARFLDDGNLLFIGRIDDQVKVRGVRIEIGDVTTALLRCHGIREAVVLPEPDGEGSQRLRAWATLTDGYHASETQIRSELTSLLPSYMVPFRIHLIDTIPLTSHGKTDQRALRAMAAADAAQASDGLPLSTPTEQTLAAIWSEILHAPVQHRDADFFRLGGHSFLALRLASRIRQTFHINLSTLDFYAEPRLYTLAAHIDEALRNASNAIHLAASDSKSSNLQAPMSFAQRRMWMLQQILPNPSAYHIPYFIPIQTGRSAAHIKSILEVIAKRHAILRTCLWQEEDKLWQKEIPIEDWILDWAEVDTPSLQAMTEVSNVEKERPFELDKGGLWRARWMSVHGMCHGLLLVFHHAVTDEWSLKLFKQEFSHLMNGNDPSLLTSPAYQYSDFARWQHSELSSGQKDLLESYWKQRLSDMSEWAYIQPDRISSTAGPGQSAHITQNLGHIQTQMNGYARSQGISRFSAWMAIWQILLARLGRAREVLIATPVTERTQPEWIDLMGICLNTLPIRTKVDSNESFLSFSNRNHKAFTNDYAHALLPYEDIVQISGLDLGPDSHGLPQTVFNLHSKHEPSDVSIATNEPDEALPPFAKSLLSLHITEQDGECDAALVYDTYRFLPQTVECILQRFKLIAEQVLENPTIRISDIDILLPGERETILQLSGKYHTVDYPKKTLQAIFRETAERYPNRAAVIDAEGRETSYAELQLQALQIAAYLRAIRIEKESVVAIYLQRSPELLASIIGVLEAGGAFLLLEPSLPMERLRTMTKQAQVSIILSNPGMPTIPGFEKNTHSYHEVLLEKIPHKLTEKGEAVEPHSLAYVMFTSGSTGIPKGAMVEHLNIINRLAYSRDALGFGIDDRTLQKSPLSFDVCLTELLLPMFTGGAVAFAEPSSEVDLPRIAELVVRLRASYLHFVPGTLKAFLQVSDVQKVNGILKIIRCGGESLSEELMHECLIKLDARLYQSYGPAETAVAVTLWSCYQGHGHPKPPIGKPNANVELLIMDTNGRPMPPGMPGELWIGGAQTGRGYIHNEEETRKRFVDDPLDSYSGKRFYRTGDMARFLHDGNLLFIGRIDDQVKVRGVRIEIGDVTTALMRCHGIREAVVLPEPDGEGSQRLRAWATRTDRYHASETQIRSELTSLLPSYMVPFRIHLIDTIPLTSHGKTDQRALRAMAAANAVEAAEGLPLSTPTEQTLAAIWSEILHAPVQYRDADFFRLGGHSLLALRLAGRLVKSFNVNIPLPEFYADPRLESLASYIDRQASEYLPAFPLIGQTEVLRHSVAPMSFGQRRMWLLQQLLEEPSAYHTSQLVPIPEDRSPAEVKAILQTMAGRHGILRTRLWQDDEQLCQQELSTDEWQIDWEELSVDRRQDLASIIETVRSETFDLANAPGWRARWIYFQGQAPQLLLVFHHALTDEWSMHLFRKELNLLMDGKKTDTLATPTLRYTDFSRWQLQALDPGRKESLEAYWRQRLAHMGEHARLLQDRTPYLPKPGRSGRATLGLDHLREPMFQFASSQGLSRFSAWMSLWQVLLSRIGSASEVLIATPVSERTQSEWLNVMGMCLNTLPIRAKIDGETTFRSFSRTNQQAFAQDLAHARLPYEEILRVSELALGPDTQGLPQVMFVQHGDYELDVAEMTAETQSYGLRYAKNPLTIELTEQKDICSITLQYDTSRFDPQNAEAILARFEIVARQVLANPEIRIADIDILLPEERHAIIQLSGRNNTVSYPLTTVHAIFRESTRRYPNRPAVIEADATETSYAELQIQTLRVAAYLSALGIKKEEVVAIHLQRSAALLATMLGILEAGGAFLLLEPSLPIDRLRTIADQARIRYILSDDSMPRVPGFENDTHHFRDILNAETTFNIRTLADSNPNDLACVIFTSGSTGVPKGAMLEHVNLTNYLFFLCDVHGLGPDVRTLQKTQLSFDPCLYEMLAPITAGGTVVMAAPSMENDTSGIIETVVRHQIRYLFFAPAQLHAFLQDPEVRKVNGIVELIQSAGEALVASTMRDCLSTLDARLTNAYGPAEAGAVTQWICHNDNDHTNIPIGPPNANVDVLILDQHGNLLPTGIPGELWIGGAQTGRGYINNPEETRKRFVKDPIEPGSGRRYYRTGDLARILPDGNILFLGRIDDQVKVRGVRIELGDVSAALLRCKGVREAVVLPEPDGEGSQRLRAWVTQLKDTTGGESDIRSALAALLPTYMVPFRIHLIDAIPLTGHGKTDQSALRALAAADPGYPAEGLPLTTTTQETLAAIWTEILRTPVKYRDADFFRLGGESLKLLRLMNRIKQQYQVNLVLKEMVQLSTIESMAAAIDKSPDPDGKNRKNNSNVVVLWEGKGAGTIYTFSSGDGHPVAFLKYKKLAEVGNWPWKVVGLPDMQAQNGEIPNIPLEELCRSYSEEILSIHTYGPIILMGDCIGGIDAYAAACILETLTDTPVHVVMLDTQHRYQSQKKKRKDEKVFTQKNSVAQKISIRLITQLQRLSIPPSDITRNDSETLKQIARKAYRLRLFDEAFYRRMNPDLDLQQEDPIEHYLRTGWQQGRMPALWFNAEGYSMLSPSFDPSTCDPIRHFLAFGIREFHVKRSILSLIKQWKKFEKGEVPNLVFDQNFPKLHSKIQISKDLSPFSQYMLEGWKKGWQASEHFHYWHYAMLESRYEIWQNPVLHYLLIGRYNPEVEASVRDSYLNEHDRQLIAGSGWFDAEWYAAQYPSVTYYGNTPLTNFMWEGWKLGRKPFADYDSAAFEAAHPGFKPGIMNPLRYLLKLRKIPVRKGRFSSEENLSVRQCRHTEGIVNICTPPLISQNSTKEYAGKSSFEALNESSIDVSQNIKDASIDIMNARVAIRVEYKPGKFSGHIDLMGNRYMYYYDPCMGWSKTLDGPYKTWPLHGSHASYLWEDLEVNTQIIQDAIENAFKRYSGEADEQSG